MSYELLTGATGLLGSYLMRDALAQGRPLAVLARGNRWLSATERVRSLLDRLGCDRMPVILEGDLLQSDLGLGAEQLDWLRQNCRRVVHSAAALQFTSSVSGEPYRTNVDGTRHLLAMCRSCGVGEMHLVSTAYVAGSRRGLIAEDDFDRGQSFSNDYERSKFLSEMLVRQEEGLTRWTIYRPSVIVGDYQTGFTTSYTGVYSLLRLAWLFSGVEREKVLAALGVVSGDGLNLVPVDWVSATMRHLVEHGRPGTTYHLTSPRPVTALALYEASARCNTRPPQVPAASLEETLSLYRPYLGEHPRFDSAHTSRDAPLLPCPELDAAALDRLVKFATDRGFQLSPEWNLKARLETFRPARSGQLVLEVCGPEGGIWSLATAEQGVAAREGESPARCRAFCNPSTLEELVSSQLSLEGALYAGLLMLESAPAEVDGSLRLLDAFLAELRDAKVGR